jgi:hypothetical protein
MKCARFFTRIFIKQGLNHRENLGATAPMVGRICPHGWKRVKISENLGMTADAPVAPVDTLLFGQNKTMYQKNSKGHFNSWFPLKVSKFQNEFMKSSFLPKYERKIVKISAL